MQENLEKEVKRGSKRGNIVRLVLLLGLCALILGAMVMAFLNR